MRLYAFVVLSILGCNTFCAALCCPLCALRINTICKIIGLLLDSVYFVQRSLTVWLKQYFYPLLCSGLALTFRFYFYILLISVAKILIIKKIRRVSFHIGDHKKPLQLCRRREKYQQIHSWQIYWSIDKFFKSNNFNNRDNDRKLKFLYVLWNMSS